MTESRLKDSPRILGQLLAVTMLLLLITIGERLQAQVGGSYTYSFLNLSPSARVSGLAGFALTHVDRDLTVGYQNPAAYNPEMHRRIAFAHAFYPAGIQHGYAAYAHHSEKLNTTFGGGILYRSYGRMQRTDPTGAQQGGFSASDYIIQAGASWHSSDKLSYGANLKLIYSQLESYSSVGMAADLAVTYNDTASMFTATLLFKNAGAQFKPYTPGQRESIPLDIQVAVSKRLRHLPLRISAVVHDIHRGDIRYDDPNAVDDSQLFFGEEEPEEPGYIADKIFRHIAFSGEFYFGESFRVRLGYDHQGRGELGVDSRPALTGFAGGFGLRIKQFHLDYGHVVHHLSGRNNHLTVTTSLSDFGSKKRKAAAE